MSPRSSLSAHGDDNQDPESGPAFTIQLIDRTLTNDESVSAETPPQSPLSPTRSVDLNLKLRSSLREQVVRRKYAKWQQNQEEDARNSASFDFAGPEQAQELPAEESRLSRSRAKIRGILNPRAATVKSGETSHMDILYENQRGTFFFGIPFFSSNSLLNFDPPAWQNAQFHSSPVDIMNAQVPDPSWQWDWSRWYVDMSRDVDEEGWEYSFKFGGRFSWHGTNPWWCSFVRRRRWLRRRVRIKINLKKDGYKDPMRAAHHFNPEYFTIHTARERSKSPTSSATESRMAPAGWKGKEEIEDDQDIKDIATLMGVLRNSKVDRQKVEAVHKFVNQGGDELFYLSEEMPHILSLLVYQSSRRQLLSVLLEKIDELHGDAHGAHEAHEEQEKCPSNENGSKSNARDGAENGDEASETGNPQREIDYLHRALETAEQQVKRLEYWSDMRQVRDSVQSGDYNPCHGVDTSKLGGSTAILTSAKKNGVEPNKDISPLSSPTTAENGKLDKGKGKEKAKG